ncbi:GGDEF domain-containing protein [Flocculibacter collagenilyticus]|uniref:GGDEF domain-containing protein n=1 Tax=Flocculibacter collagenilyticus TaxID=2744479 RepID=UPI0018F2B81B|nr:GGDEF domain-containing protein [Flocculibacter collagenilyticus]
MSDKIKQLTEELQKSKDARLTLEKSYEAQFQTLTNLVSKLSQVCKGIDFELDSKLGKLRNSLKKNPDMENIIPLIEDVSKSLTQIESRQIHNIHSTHSTFHSAGKILQGQKGLPDQLRRDLRGLLTSVSTPQSSITSYIPVLDKLVLLYQKAFEAKNQLASAQGNEKKTASSASGAQASQEINKITQELINLVSQLAFEGEHAEAIDSIKGNLLNIKDADELLTSSMNIIKLIVDNYSDERKSAELFVLSVNDALSSVQQVLTTSLEQNKSFSAEMAALNQQIQSQITELSQETQTAKDLKSLKLLVSKKLKIITENLTKKEQLEVNERKSLMNTMSVMESKLEEVEKKAVSYQKRLSEQTFKSLQDALTKLPNRAALDERLEIEYTRWKRYNTSLCIAVVDVDFFKRINDTYGHSAGDKTLQVISKALKRNIRAADFLARYGGEEFVIIFPDSTLEQIKKPLEKLREAVKQLPFKFKNKAVTISVSIGVTAFKKGDRPQQAFDRADEALYAAKNGGRDQVVIHK